MRPTNLHTTEDEALVLTDNYLNRYHACSRILKSYGISLELTSLRKVFPLICRDDKNSNLTAAQLKESYQEALQNLLYFIAHYGEEVDYTGLSKEALDDAFLDECYADKPDAARLRRLLELGVSLQLRENSTSAPAYLRAMNANNIELLRLFLEHGGDVNYKYAPYPHSKADYYETYWLRNIANTPLPQIELMLQYGAKLHDRNGEGDGLLHLIGESRVNMDVLKLFMRLGVDMNTPNKAQETPLLRFCKMEVNVEAAAYLLECGADAKSKNLGGTTAAHRAAAWWDDKTGFLMKLVQKSADINAQDSLGQTPLYIATSRNNERIVQALLGVGANAQIANQQGKKPYDLALEQGFLKVAQLLNENAVQDYMNRPEYQRIQQLKVSIVAALKAGKSWSRGDKEGWQNLLYIDGKYKYETGEHQSDYTHTSYYNEAEALQFMYNNLGYYDKLNKTEVEMWEAVARWLGVRL